LKYCVGRNAESMGKVLWKAHEKAVGGNTSGNSRQTNPEATAERANASIERH
jgi:hypothetical protein